MKLKWTKADERRAARMGWYLAWHRNTGSPIKQYYIALAYHTFSERKFKSRREAIEWVLEMSCGIISATKQHVARTAENRTTCRKAILLCAGAEDVK